MVAVADGGGARQAVGVSTAQSLLQILALNAPIKGARMPLPAILGLGASFLGRGGLAAVAKKVGVPAGFGVAKKKRRRRARLTMRELNELNHIKSILGKTAAANALPYYLGRGG